MKDGALILKEHHRNKVERQIQPDEPSREKTVFFWNGDRAGETYPPGARRS